MSRYQGLLWSQSFTSGGATVTIGDSIMKAGTHSLWDKAVFGLSVTAYSGTASFSCDVIGDLGGINVPIAGITGVASLTKTLIPIVSQLTIGGATTGTTQVAHVGIPVPRRIVFGSSAIIVGNSEGWSADVYCMLQNES